MAATDLITLAELRSLMGTDVTNTSDDAKYTALIPAVSDTIRSFTERDFGQPIITEQRSFDYDGSGYLDIDDATAVSAVAFSYPTSTQDVVLSPTDWNPQPSRRDDAPVYTYLALPGYSGGSYGSAEMGFTRNLDVFVREHSGVYSNPPIVKVTATWGWPSVPSDVKLAAVWLAQAWATRPTSDGLSSEAIEGWSRSWGARNSVAAQAAVPGVVRDILANYAKFDL